MSNSDESLESTNVEETFFPSQHRCFRCNHFYNRCICYRRMYNHFKHGCMCRIIIKILIVATIVALIFYFMNKNKKMHMPIFDN